MLVTPVESAGMEQIVKHDATTLSMTHASEGAAHATVYELDGSENRNIKQVWSLDSGRLVIELAESMQGGSPRTSVLVHKKQ